MTQDWTGIGKVRARERDGAVEIMIDGLTTQAKYYKPLVYEFMRKDWSSRPSWGDFVVEIRMEHVGEPPHIDLDNLAKALMDAVHDDDAGIWSMSLAKVWGFKGQIRIEEQIDEEAKAA